MPATVPDPSPPTSAPVPAGNGIRLLTGADADDWDALVKRSAQGTLFHRPFWFASIGKSAGHYGYYRGGQLCAGCTVGLVAEGSAGHPLLTPYLGPVLPPASGKYVTTLSDHKDIIGLFAERLRQDFAHVVLRLAPEFVDLQPFLWAGYTAGVRYTYRLQLDDEAGLLSRMDSKRRNDLKRAEREGVQVESGVSLMDVLPQAENTFRRKGAALNFRAEAERLSSACAAAGNGRGFLARGKNGAVIGAAWIVWDEKRAYYLVGGYDESAQSGPAAALALWHAILYTTRELKLPEFDFEGSMIPPVERFFRKFGGALVPTYTVTWHRPRSLTHRLMARVARMLRTSAAGPQAPRAS